MSVCAKSLAFEVIVLSRFVSDVSIRTEAKVFENHSQVTLFVLVDDNFCLMFCRCKICSERHQACFLNQPKLIILHGVAGCGQ